MDHPPLKPDLRSPDTIRPWSYPSGELQSPWSCCRIRLLPFRCLETGSCPSCFRRFWTAFVWLQPPVARIRQLLARIDSPKYLPDISADRSWSAVQKLLTIASYDEKLIVVCDVVCHDVWKSCDYLLLGREIRTLLEFEVANGSGKCKVAIDSTKVDEAASGADTSLLACIQVKRSAGTGDFRNTAHLRSAVYGQRIKALLCL